MIQYANSQPPHQTTRSLIQSNPTHTTPTDSSSLHNQRLPTKPSHSHAYASNILNTSFLTIAFAKLTRMRHGMWQMHVHTFGIQRNTFCPHSNHPQTCDFRNGAHNYEFGVVSTCQVHRHIIAHSTHATPAEQGCLRMRAKGLAFAAIQYRENHQHKHANID